jgi:hypothetical protein
LSEIGMEYTYTIEDGQYTVTISIEKSAVRCYAIHWTKNNLLIILKENDEIL